MSALACELCPSTNTRPFVVYQTACLATHLSKSSNLPLLSICFRVAGVPQPTTPTPTGQPHLSTISPPATCHQVEIVTTQTLCPWMFPAMTGLTCPCGENVLSLQHRLAKPAGVGKVIPTTNDNCYPADVPLFFPSENQNATNKGPNVVSAGGSVSTASIASLSPPSMSSSQSLGLLMAKCWCTERTRPWYTSSRHCSVSKTSSTLSMSQNLQHRQVTLIGV